MFGFLKNLFTSETPKQPVDRTGPVTWLVIGLGNPGAKYEATRHNIGYLVVDQLAGQLAPVSGCKALTQQVGEVLYVRATTFMNLSGEAVAPLAQLHTIPPDRVIVVHDELDLPAGKVRIKVGGNENGHNGLKSISDKLGTREYVRVRVGIGRPPAGVAVPDWVLSPIEMAPEALQEQLALAGEAAQLVCREGVQKAQNAIHPRS